MPTIAQDKASESSYRVRGLVKGRLELPHQTRPLKLGMPNNVPVQLHGYAVHSAFAQFTYLDSAGNTLFDGRETEAALKYNSDGSAYLVVVPERVGKAELWLGVYFEDGGAQSARVGVDVALPDEKPEKFLVASGSDDGETRGLIYLDLSSISDHIRLGPEAIYSEDVGPVPIPDEDVQFKIISASAADPPIRLDPSTGWITALHLGHALVQTSFDDLYELTCVDVMEDASGGGDRTNCAELVPPGMTPPSEPSIEGKKPPSMIKIVPQL